MCQCKKKAKTECVIPISEYLGKDYVPVEDVEKPPNVDTSSFNGINACENGCSRPIVSTLHSCSKEKKGV